MPITPEPTPAPTPTETARATKGLVTKLSATFMLDAGTYADAAAAGYEGLAFYFAGRGGVLGDVDAAEVATALYFFPESSVRAGWEQAATVEPPHQSAVRFAEACARWATANLEADVVDFTRLAELVQRVIDAADVADPATVLFAGWRELAEPSDPRSLVVHRANALRELRFARHLTAMRSTGLSPLEAFTVSSPYMADVFGWPQPLPELSDQQHADWAQADEDTDIAFGLDLAVLDAAERAEFIALAKATSAAARR